MTDMEKLLAKTRNAFCVEEITTKRTYFNCCGDKIDESVSTRSGVFIYDEDNIEWHKGLKENKK